MNGKCLCGSVEFQISGEFPRIYQRHCSLCRKVSGSSSNSALLVSSQRFSWLAGENHIQVRYPDQQIHMIAIEKYVYLVSFIESGEEVFLKTIIPSRKATKAYRGAEK